MWPIISKLIKILPKYIMYLLWFFLPSTSIPEHIAIIMDGNRRFAREKKLDDVTLGHRAGFDKMVDVVKWCIALGIKETTVYAFSLENFNRYRFVLQDIEIIHYCIYETVRSTGPKRR